MMKHSLRIALSAAAISLCAVAQPTTITSVTTADFLGGFYVSEATACGAGGCGASVAFSFTLNQGYAGVTINASIYGSTFLGPTTGTIYLTNAIGAAATAANVISTRPANTLPLDTQCAAPDPKYGCAPPIPLFTGLQLPAGTYYVILADASGSIDAWRAHAPVVLRTAGGSPANDVLLAFPVNATFPPASTFGVLAPMDIVFSVTGSAGVSKAGIFRQGFFWMLDADGNQQLNVPPDKAFAFGGVFGDVPITGDWNGDGRTKVGVYRASSGLFILDYDGDGFFTAADKVYNLGVGTLLDDVPVTGDWNGDGRTKIGLFRQGFFWIIDANGNGTFDSGIDGAFAFGGVLGDVPVVGDWNGSGSSKVGIVRAGFLWILDSNGNRTFDSGDQVFPFGGLPGDVPITGDWNGDGRSKPGVFRMGFFWVLDTNGDHVFQPGIDQAFAFGGILGDKPVVGRW
jgi:hypothetical protein